jgi:hypothetical protein
MFNVLIRGEWGTRNVSSIARCGSVNLSSWMGRFILASLVANAICWMSCQRAVGEFSRR